MRRALGAVLGAFAGFGFTTLGLRDAFRFFSVEGGNEATATVILVGVVIGTVTGATLLWRWPLALVGLSLGLEIGMWLRDNGGRGPAQAPWVFLLLFGFPLLGTACGYAVHRARGLRTARAY
jgi:hypothetical protein